MAASTQGYLPTLDGWRAIAVFSVIIFHGSLISLGSITPRWLNEHGGFGVDIFFGISGFLICSRLIQEEQCCGYIDLRQFYIRRFFRIFPPLLCYLFCAAILAILGVIPLATKEWITSLLFCRNYSFLSRVPGHDDWYTGHFWSLSVEEHFYLVLPGIMALLPRSRRAGILIGLAASVEIWRVYQQQTRPWIYIFQHSDIRLDALLIPSVMAILLARKRWKCTIIALARGWPVAAILLIYLVTTDQWPITSHLAEPFLVPIVLISTVYYPRSILARFLELAPIRWIGKLSYSLYLWQQLFFTGHFFKPLGVWQEPPLQWLLLLLCGTLSYYLVEKPLIKLGRALAGPSVPARVDLVST